MIVIIVLFTIFSFGQSVSSFVDDFVNRTGQAVVLDPKYNDFDINPSQDYFTSSDNNQLSKAFKLSFVNAGFIVQLKDNVFYITKDSPSSQNVNNDLTFVVDNTNYEQYFYNLKYITFDDLSTAMSIFPNLNIKYLKSYNQISFSCDKKDYKKIIKFISSLDVPIRSKKIKITIFTSSDDVASDIGLKISKLGLHLNSEISQDTNFLNYLLEFDAYFNALKNSNKITISQSPTFFLFNGNKLVFKSVKNIPYLTQSSSVQNTGTNTTSSYSYKDIGLQIELTPHISKKSSLLDLNLKIEDLIDLNSDKPLTNKLEYSNTVILSNSPILLTGLKKTINSDNVISVPFLSDIPFLGEIFKFRSKVYDVSNMSILIEFVR